MDCIQKKLVKTWTLKHPHIGCKSSSRPEGVHAYIKKLLQVSTGALLTVLNKLQIALDHQIKTEVDRRSKETMHYFLELQEMLHL